jgi:hypothetical protein
LGSKVRARARARGLGLGVGLEGLSLGWGGTKVDEVTERRLVPRVGSVGRRRAG